MSAVPATTGEVTRVAGPIVEAAGLDEVKLHDVVHVGRLRCIGEVILLRSGVATVQVYDDTSGLRVGDPVFAAGTPLTVELGPGLLGQVFDGLQRPLSEIARLQGPFIGRGASPPALASDRHWRFRPVARPGQSVGPGDILGVVQESPSIEHRVMTPPGVHGRVERIEERDATADTVVATIVDQGNSAHGSTEVTLAHRWPVRVPRPFRRRLDPAAPLVTGLRVIDTCFPVAKGGSAIVPGGFGTGKTVIEQSLARWSEVDVVVYVGCGERGNEMADVLEEMRFLEDPRTGAPLLQRTILVANTSNMPVAAREASIYTGVTMAEYYRDMGYDVLLLADSTSRWGEALREVSGRLEEMPGEEGYPAYLAARLTEFYERSGLVTCLGSPVPTSRPAAGGERTGSVTIVGAVSPPGADFSEPMTQSSMRVTGGLWSLDYDLSSRRHFPAINWTRSYSLYDLSPWYVEHLGRDWPRVRQAALSLLQREAELREIVQLVGPDALSDEDHISMFVARMLREDFLQQSALDGVDRFCPLAKGGEMLKTIVAFGELASAAVAAGVGVESITALPQVAEIARMKGLPLAEAPELIAKLRERLPGAFAALTERAQLTG